MPTTKEEKVFEVDGKKIIKIRTLSSMYDNGHIIELEDNKKKVYRMSITQFLLGTISNLTFKAEKKTKHTWLTIDESKL